jgi:hypothetical protein
MATEHHDIVEHSIEAFSAELVKFTLDGWAISPTNPGDSVGFGQTYTVSLYRDEATVEAFRIKADNFEPKVKMTRAESLAKAREAKAAGKSAAKLDVNSVQ